MGKLLIPKRGEVKTVEGPSAKLKLQVPRVKLDLSPVLSLIFDIECKVGQHGLSNDTHTFASGHLVGHHLQVKRSFSCCSTILEFPSVLKKLDKRFLFV